MPKEVTELSAALQELTYPIFIELRVIQHGAHSVERYRANDPAEAHNGFVRINLISWTAILTEGSGEFTMVTLPEILTVAQKTA